MISFQFVAADDPGSKLIEVFERGWPSHVDCVLADGTLLGARNDAIGNVKAGVQIRPAFYNAWTRREVVTLDVTAQQETDWLNFLEAQIGKPYDMTAIVAFAVQRDWRAPDSWFCSELAAASLEQCGFFPKPLAVPANEVTPRDLLVALSPWAK